MEIKSSRRLIQGAIVTPMICQIEIRQADLGQRVAQHDGSAAKSAKFFGHHRPAPIQIAKGPFHRAKHAGGHDGGAVPCATCFSLPIAVERFLRPAKDRKSVAQPQPGFGAVRFEIEAVAIGDGRLFDLSGALAGNGEFELDVGLPGQKAQRIAPRLDGAGAVTACASGVRQVVQHRRIVREQARGHLEMRQGVGGSPLARQQCTQVAPCFRIAGLKIHRRLDQHRRPAQIALPLGDHPAEMPAFRVLGIGNVKPRAKFFGLPKAPSSIMAEGLGK